MEEHGGNIYEREIILDFSVNVNPFGMPETVKEAALRGVLQSERYPDLYKRNLTKALSKQYHIKTEQIVTGNGAAELIYGIAFALRPEKSLIIGPTFSEYEKALLAYGSQVVHYFTKAENAYEVGMDVLDIIEESECNMMFVCNPNNPTGRLIAPALLEQMIILCENRGIYLVIDECFMELTQKENHPCRNRISTCNYLIILKAFTKSFAMPGLRLGFIFVGSLDAAKQIQSILPPWNVSMPAQFAGEAAAKETVYIQSCMELLIKERTWVCSRLEQFGYKVYPSDTIFLLLEGPEHLQDFCLQHKILIRDAGSFPGIKKNTYRIGIKTHADNEKLLAVLKKAAGECTWQK